MNMTTPGRALAIALVSSCTTVTPTTGPKAEKPAPLPDPGEKPKAAQASSGSRHAVRCAGTPAARFAVCLLLQGWAADGAREDVQSLVREKKAIPAGTVSQAAHRWNRLPGQAFSAIRSRAGGISGGPSLVQ